MNNTIRTWTAFLFIVIGFFMVLLDSTIVNITLPVITQYYKTDMETVSWVVNAYNLAFAVFLMSASRIADQFGRKKVFRIGITLFTFFSLMSGLSHSIEMLIFFRVLQGLSGALIVPVSMPLIIDLFPPSKSGMVIGLWGGVAGVAAASGPALGGIISEFLNWQWIFYINIPIGIVCIILTTVLVKESFDPTASKRIDWAGMLLLSFAMFCVTLGLIQANDKGWGSAYILTLFALSVVSFIAFYFTEKTVREPMLPILLFRNLNFSMTNISLVFLGMGLMSGVFFMSFFLTRVMEMSQLRAGLIITALPLAAMVFSAVSGYFSDKYGSRWFAVAGSILLSYSLYLMSSLTAHSSLKEIIIKLVISGAATGIALPPVVRASIRATPEDKLGIASAVGNVFRTLGAILGVALLVTAVTHFSEIRINEARRDAAKMIMSSSVFVKEVKDTLAGSIVNAKFTKDSNLPTEEDVVCKFEDRKQKALKSAPGMMKPMVEKMYDKQIKEISKIYPLIKDIFLSKIALAFSVTFKLAAAVLMLGVAVAFFSEPFSKRKKINK